MRLRFRLLAGLLAAAGFTLSLAGCSSAQMTSTIPAKISEHMRLSQMAVGQMGYMHSLDLWVDTQFKGRLPQSGWLTLNPDSLEYIRVVNWADGYHVWLPAGLRWSMTRGPIIPDKSDYGPAVTV